MKRLIGLVVALTALSAGVATSSAGAGTQWYFERQDIPPGETVEVPAHGTLNLYLKEAKQTRIEMSCAVTGTEAFWNTPDTGMGETKSIAFDCTAPCGEVVITPQLPWTSALLAPAPMALPDEWNGVRLGLRCGATDYGVFAGTLNPVSGDGDEQGPEAPDEADSFVNFVIGQTLYAPSGSRLTFQGYYKLGYEANKRKVDVVTGEPS